MSASDFASSVILQHTFEMVQRLADAAFISPLAGLFNKAAFDRVAGELDRHVEMRSAVAFMDLTGFKGVNDRYGHDAGDATIREAGKKWREAADRIGGHAYHLSGDEFLLVFAETEVGSFHRWAKEMLTSIRVEFQGSRFDVRANIGVALPSDGTVLDRLRSRAELACRMAKARRLDVPLVWSENDTEEKLIDQRWRCTTCQATVALLLPQKNRRDGSLFRCPNCQESLPNEQPLPP